MIKIDARGTEFAAKLDISHEFYARVYLLLRSLLSAKGAEPDVYTLSYMDLLALKKKLDSMGLVEGRTMTKAAMTLIKDYQASDKRNNDIKKGIHNELVEQSLEGKLKTVPYVDQLTGISYCIQNRRSGLFDSMGVGKAQPLSSKILTPTGWVLMGDVQVGDPIINSQGGTSKVIGVFPQGKRLVYRVTFSDGASTECCGEHLWHIQSPSSKYQGCRPKVRQLQNFKDDLFYKNGNRKHYIPIVKPIEFEERELPLHPYVLGFLLGDGGLSHQNVSFTTEDAEVVSNIGRLLPEEVYIRRRVGTITYGISKTEGHYANVVLDMLRGLDLMGRKSNSKFIPDIYKFASKESRLELLRGLFDADGYCSPSSNIEYVSVSERLALDAQFLVWSFGGKATLSTKTPTYTYKGKKKEGQLAYRLHISFPGNDTPFKLSRKADVWKPRTKYPPTRGFDKVECVGEKEAQCISVDAPDQLYITDDFIVTHNTIQALGSLISLGPKVRRTLVICPKSVMLGFGREIEKHTHLTSVSIPPGRKVSLEFLKKHKTGNWDLMLVHPENLIASGKQAIYGDVTKLLKTMKFDMVIVDEWHMYKNDDAKRSKCVLSLLAELRDREAKPPRAILMTGTPVSESPMNAYVTLKVLSNEHLPNISRFETYFTHKEKKTMTLKPKKGVNGKKGRRSRQISFDKVVGYKNLGELKSRLEAVSIRRTKEDMVGFPDKTTIIRDVILSGKQEKLYKAVCNEIIADLSSSSKINLAKFFADSAKTVRLRQLLNHPQFIDETCESAKYLELDSILEEVMSDPEQKVIIWSEYRRAIDFIYDRWNALYGVVKIRGGVEIDDALANSFEYDPKIRIAAAIPAKAGTGTDFLARARTAIYIDRPYSYTQYKQSLDRIHRRVKTVGELTWLDRMRSQPATLIFLDVVGSLDELVRMKLEGKGDIADALTVENEKLLSIGKAELLRYLR